MSRLIVSWILIAIMFMFIWILMLLRIYVGIVEIMIILFAILGLFIVNLLSKKNKKI